MARRLKRKWIQGAIKKPGALRTTAKRMGTTVSGLITSPPKKAGTLLKRRINLARTLKGLRRKVRISKKGVAK